MPFLHLQNGSVCRILISEVEITEEIKRGKGYWKFNTSLLKENEYTELIKGTIEEAKQELRNGEWDSIEDWWEYLKKLLKAITINFCRGREQARRNYLAELYRKIEMLKNDVSFNIGGEQTKIELSEAIEEREKE